MNAIIEQGEKWFIWTKKGKAPSFAHRDEASAVEEAKRLALKFPGQKFHVMKSVAKISAAPAITDSDQEQEASS